IDALQANSAKQREAFAPSLKLRRTSRASPARLGGNEECINTCGGNMRALHVLGRTIFGGFFLYNGINHLQNTEAMAQYAGAKGVPAPQQAVQATGAMLLAGGLSIIAGLKPRQGLALITAFLVPVSL